MTIVFDDTFSGVVAGIGIETRPPNVGTGWTRHPNYTTGLEITDVGDGNLARSNVITNGDGKYVTDNPGVADYRATATHTRITATTSIRFGVEVRASGVTANRSCYRAQWSPGDGSSFVALYVVDTAGAPTQVAGTGTVGKVWAVGDSHDLALDVVGSTLTVYWDGVAIITGTDTTLTGAARAGIYVRVIGTPTDYPLGLDRFKVEVASTSPVGPALLGRPLQGGFRYFPEQ